MRVGVTGASGLIGRSLVAALKERGDDVVTFRRPTSNTTAANSIRWDPAHHEVDENDLRRCGELDAVINLAGAGIGDRRWSPAREAEILTSRVNATSTLATALQGQHAVSTVLNASAIGWYGTRGDDLLDETSPRGTGFLADVCHAWEEAARPLVATGTTVAYLRTGPVLDAHGGVLRQQLAFFRLGLGGRYGSGRQWMSPVSLADEIRAVIWILDHRLAGPVNIVAPSPLINRDFTRELARALHRPAFFAVPRVALELALGSEMASELVFASQRVLPGVLGASGFHFEHPDAPSALVWALASAQ